MHTRITITLAAAALALWSAATPAALKNIENAYESDTTHVTLPSGPGGRVVVRECERCKPVALRSDRRTAWFIGSAAAPVTLAALRAAVAEPREAPRMVTVFYNLDTGVVTRVVLSDG